MTAIACREGYQDSGGIMAAKATTAAAPADEATDEQEAQPKRQLPLKLIIIAAAALLVVGGGGIGAYFAFSGKKAAGDTKAAAPVAKPVAFLDLPDVLVNLASPGGDRTHYLKLKIVLEVPEQTMIPLIQPLMPRVMDTFQTYLRELRPSDLEGSAGLYRLKEELTRRVNAAIEPARINAVLFKELLVQ
jgi:flagellar FliL protein